MVSTTQSFTPQASKVLQLVNKGKADALAAILNEVKGKLRHLIVSGIKNPDFRTAVFMHWKDGDRKFKYSRDIDFRDLLGSDDCADTELLLGSFICSKRFSLNEFIQESKCWVFIDCAGITVRANDEQVLEKASGHLQGRIHSIYEHMRRRCG